MQHVHPHSLFRSFALSFHQHRLSVDVTPAISDTPAEVGKALEEMNLVATLRKRFARRKGGISTGKIINVSDLYTEMLDPDGEDGNGDVDVDVDEE